MSEPWNRAEDETDAQFRGFTIYRDLGPTRELRSAAAIYADVEVATVSTVDRMKKWSAQRGWVARCQAWDSYLDNQMLALVADQVTDARARHAAAARIMVDKVAERLTEVDPSELSVSELARWIDVAVKVERLALGDAGQILETREVGTTEGIETRRERARSVIDDALARMAEDD